MFIFRAIGSLTLGGHVCGVRNNITILSLTSNVIMTTDSKHYAWLIVKVPILWNILYVAVFHTAYTSEAITGVMVFRDSCAG